MADLAGASDALLASRAAEGDELAFGVLVRRHGPYLRAFAIRLLGRSADADDAVQDALITAWDRLDTLAEPERVRSWLTTIVSRKATDRIRSRRPTSELDEEAPSTLPGPEQSAIVGSQLEALDRILDALPAGQRQCWLLKEVAGYSYEQIAQNLGVTPAVVRGRLARGEGYGRERDGGVAMTIGDSGYTLDELSDYLDRGREPAIPAIDDDPECQAVLASLERVGALSRELVQRDEQPLDESFLSGLLGSITRELRAGRDIPLASADDSVTLAITEGAIRELVRTAGDSVPGVLVGSCSIELGDEVLVHLTISVLLGMPVLTAADAVRQRVHGELSRHTRLAIGPVDVTVVDVHEATP